MLWTHLTLLAGVDEIVAMHLVATRTVFVDDATLSCEHDEPAARIDIVAFAAE
jgi:hypothetical protein